MSKPGQIQQDTATPEPTWTLTPTITPTPTATFTPTPVVMVYTTFEPGRDGEGQAAVFEYRADGGQVLISMLLFIQIVLKVFEMYLEARRVR